MLNQRMVTVINPQLQSGILQSDTLLRKKRVCAYARVSTDQEDQINSYKAQISEYTKVINENSEWIFQGMYADEGLSGTSIKKRLQFQKMIQDAKDGKIDLILTKSISRFARNTVDSLTIIRELRNIGVEIYFEKENISSSDTKVDFMLTIFSSIAQEESRNISENVKWGFRKRYKEGVVHINTKRFLGYDKDEHGKIMINQAQADIVKMIFNLYIAGLSTREIAEQLTLNKIVNGRGEVFWKPATITTILTNEKYCGDVVLQKRVTVDYLTHKSIINTGQAPKYYITNNHEAIISKEVFMIVQNIKKDRSNQPSSSRFANRFPLSGIVYCGLCLRKMNRQHYNPNTTYGRVVMSCKNTTTKKCKCDSVPIDNNLLERLSAHVFHTVHEQHPGYIDEVISLLEPNFTLPQIHQEVESIRDQIQSIEDEIKALIQLRISSHSKDDDIYYQKLFDEKKAAHKALQLKQERLEKNMMDTHLNQERVSQIKQFLKEYSEVLNRETLTSLIQKVVIHSPENVTFIGSKTAIPDHEFEERIESILEMKEVISGKYSLQKMRVSWRFMEWEN